MFLYSYLLIRSILKSSGWMVYTVCRAVALQFGFDYTTLTGGALTHTYIKLYSDDSTSHRLQKQRICLNSQRSIGFICSAAGRQYQHDRCTLLPLLVVSHQPCASKTESLRDKHPRLHDRSAGCDHQLDTWTVSCVQYERRLQREVTVDCGEAVGPVPAIL